MKRFIALIVLILSSATYAQESLPAPDVLEAIDAAVTVATNQGLEYDLTYMYDGVVVVYTFAKKKPVTLGMRFFLQGGDLYISSVLQAEGISATKRGPKKAEKRFYIGLQAENERRGSRCCYAVTGFDSVLFGPMNMLSEEPK